MKDMLRPSLAAVAICKNEERNLPGFINNLIEWVDEIVIVDDGSTDRSREIVEAAGKKAIFVYHKMSQEQGYAGQRNVGIETATSDWLLHMDCDERVTRDLAEEIRAAIQSTEYSGFRYRRLNYFLHRPMKHGGWASWNHPQLARCGQHRFHGRLHERCEIGGGAAKIGQLSSFMLHLNEESFEERLKKSARYVEMTAQGYAAGGANVTGSRIFFRTAREFVKKYLLQKGFLDGTPGLIAALHSATAEFRAQALVWDKQHTIPRTAIETRALLRIDPKNSSL
jgi:glycosyltransferase involved in cell wall biosynthesis